MSRATSAQHTALIASITEDGRERAIALAELAHDSADPTLAEVAVVVRDDYQREGLGNRELRELWELARNFCRCG